MSYSTMVERVAKATMKFRYGSDDPSDYPALWPGHLEMARVAIAAMRDVDSGTPEMLRCGKNALYSCASDPELEDARKCWEAMIDAALEETA